MIDRRSEADSLSTWTLLTKRSDDVKTDRGRGTGAHKSQASVATTSVEYRRAAMFRAGRLVVVLMGLSVGQMALGEQVTSVFYELD